MNEVIEPGLPEDLKIAMTSLKEVISETLSPRPYALLVFDPNEDGKGGRLAFVTNAPHEDLCSLMRDFIAAHERGQASPGRHQ